MNFVMNALCWKDGDEGAEADPSWCSIMEKRRVLKKNFYTLEWGRYKIFESIICYGESAVPNIKIVDGGKCKNKEIKWMRRYFKKSAMYG